LTDPIEKTLTVPLDAASAFDLYTGGIDRWWPKDTHSLAAADGRGAEASVRVEPHVGGKVIETLPDGSEAPWGTVTAWEPGARFGLKWFVGRDESEATYVDIRFTQTEAGTRIDLTHGGFDALGDQAETMCANYTKGWDHVLGTCYGGACQKRAA
jgi:hypothetical protein